MKRYVDYWQLILIKDLKKNIEYYKLLTTTKGGYDKADSWRLSSPLVNVKKVGNTYEFTTYSGATYAIVNGEERELFKDPITDSKKKSHKGKMCLIKHNNGTYETLDQVSEDLEHRGVLKEVFRDGELLVEQTFSEIRERAKER